MDYTAAELAHEREMAEDGESRYYAHTLRAREKGQLTLTVPGRSLARRVLRPVEEALAGWVYRASTGPARDALALPYLSRLDLGAVSLLTSVTIIDSLHRPRGATSLATALGRVLEDEDRFRHLYKEDPELWRHIRDTTKTSSPTHRRRVAVHLGGRDGALPSRWPSRDRLRVGYVVLEAFHQATGLIEFSNEPMGTKWGVRKKLIVRPTEEIMEWLDKADEHAAGLSPLYMPTLVPPRDWEGVVGGGYPTDIVLKRPVARFRSSAQQRTVEEADGKFPQVYAALNKLQSVSWRVNEDVLEVLSHLAKTDGGPLPEFKDEPLPLRPQDVPHPEKFDDENVDQFLLLGISKEDAEKTWKDWRRRAARTRDANFVRRSRRVLLQRNIQIATKLRHQGTLYFPHRLDFRGRAYPIPYWVQPQGPDLGRSLIEFAEPTEMTQEGFYALMVYGALLWGEKGTRDDLSSWMSTRLDHVKRVCQDPITYTWWHESDEPFQFLAWCLEVGRLLEEEGKQSFTRLPVHVDASNNGLQLFSLLVGDRRLAQSTNVIPSEDGRPRDIYSEVGTSAWDYLHADFDHPGWCKALPEVYANNVPREACKRPVMTLPYGVTDWSARDYVIKWHNTVWPIAPDGTPSTPFEDVNEACGVLSSAIMTATREECSGAVECMDWLRDVADMFTAKGISARWDAPTGWPVVQSYRRAKSKRIRALLGGAVRNLRLREYGSKVDGRRQRNGISPNYVHCFDAAIMARAVGGWERPLITSVHDDYGVPAPHVPQLLEHLLSTTVRTMLPRISGSENSRPIEVTRNQFSRYLQVPINGVPEAPHLGEIDPEEVMAAEYMYL